MGKAVRELGKRAKVKNSPFFGMFVELGISEEGGENVNFVNVCLGICAALIYAFLGYAAQDKAFNWKKFLRTVAIGTFSALGLDLAGMTFDVYTALVGPTAITVWLQKLVDTASQ